MYKIIYIDDEPTDIHRFERDMDGIFDVHAIQIVSETILEDLIDGLVANTFDYLIVDFHLNDRTNCGYNGDAILKGFLEKLPHFPAMLLTNFDESAIKTAKDLDVDKIHSKFSNEDETRLFVTRVETKIEQYQNQKQVASTRLIELKQKAVSEVLTVNEEEEALELDTFLEETLDAKSPDLAKAILSSNGSRLEALLEKTDSLIEKLKEYENLSK
jgi:ActR/RegA family two-component response regulator